MNPEQILEHFNITQPDEIDIEAIAQHFGATVVYEPLTGCEARVIGHCDSAYISVCPCQHSRGRERFSAAHELGHWLKDRGIVSGCTLDQMVEWGAGREMRANRFASDLLLPVNMFKSYARGRPATLEAASELAANFEMSLTATALRLVQYGDYPAVLACYGRNGLRWCKRGPEVPESLWLSKHPPSDLFSTQKQPRTQSADQWFEHEDAHQYEVIDDCAIVTPDVVIVLLSWGDDESQIIELGLGN